MTINNATKIMFERYLQMSISDHINALCSEGIHRIDELPIDKLSRWLGFVQGVAIERGFCSVESERDFSRPLFQEAYRLLKVDVPSIDVLQN